MRTVLFLVEFTVMALTLLASARGYFAAAFIFLALSWAIYLLPQRSH